MPQPAINIIARALQRAKVGNLNPNVPNTVVGYGGQALQELNSLLDFIAETIDFAAAMGTFSFNFNTSLVNLGAGNIVQAAPNPLPLDYLRVQTSGGATGAQRSSVWYLQGVPYPMVEIDLTEWDEQVQQAGMQSYPYFWAKDMSQKAIIANIQGDLSTGTTLVNNVSSVTGIAVGMSIAGGIGPVSLITPGTTITAVTPGTPNTLTLSQLPSLPNGATVTQAQASLMVGYPPVGLPYPPPSGNYNVRIRYQRLMPPLTTAQVAAGAFCWFPDDDVLIEGLAGMLMQITDDSRMGEFIGSGLRPGSDGGRFGMRLDKYIGTADDKANRGQSVQLDRRTFGRNFSILPQTKVVGW